MPALSQTVLDGFQCCRHPIPACLSYQHEPAVTIFPTDVREPEEVERFWFAFFPAGAVFGSEAAELHQSGFLRMYRESELLQSALHGYTEAPGVDRLSNPMTMFGVSDHYHIACGMAASPLMRPQIEDIVEVDVCQQR
jgi:hypothetical protein